MLLICSYPSFVWLWVKALVKVLKPSFQSCAFWSLFGKVWWRRTNCVLFFEHETSEIWGWLADVCNNQDTDCSISPSCCRACSSFCQVRTWVEALLWWLCMFIAYLAPCQIITVAACALERKLRPKRFHGRHRTSICTVHHIHNH